MAKKAPEKDLKLIRPIIGRYVRILKEHQLKLEALYLYGSFVRGAARWDSDIDLAVISGSLSGHPVNDFVFLAGLRAGIDERIEPHPFRPEDFTEDNPEAAEIMRTGIRIL